MFTEDDVQQITRGYMEELKEKFMKIIRDEMEFSIDEKIRVHKLLGYAINQVKSDISAKDAYERGGR